ncbi:protein shisa-5 isoform X3 [Bos mutus]|uniref:protein shisa-5 isoform X3 n=2 Tax=Bos mutus TaxID=72004 RepID=UPI0038B5CC7C
MLRRPVSSLTSSTPASTVTPWPGIEPMLPAVGVWSLGHWSADWLSVRFGTVIAIGVTLFVIAVVTVIVCCTCSCCCLYKMCRRPQPVVTTTMATTVTHTPYLQPPSYPGPTYQGYHSVVPQPGMPTAPYPTQPMGPPAYHETMAGGAALPYAASQPPYNPAYMEPPKAVP